MGVNVGRIKMMTFAIVGVVAAFAGLIVSLEVLYFGRRWAKATC